MLQTKIAQRCCAAGFQFGLCRLWVTTGHSAMSAQCPLWPTLRTQVGHVARSKKCHEPTFAIDDILNCACHQATDTSAAATRLGAERCCNFMGTPDRERCDVSGCLRKWVNHIS